MCLKICNFNFYPFVWVPKVVLLVLLRGMTSIQPNECTNPSSVWQSLGVFGGLVDWWLDGWMDGWMDGWVDGWMGRKRTIEGVWWCDVWCFMCVFFLFCLELKNLILEKHPNNKTNKQIQKPSSCDVFFLGVCFVSFSFELAMDFSAPKHPRYPSLPKERGDESILWGVGSSWLEFSIGNPSSIRVHLPASYVSLLEGNRLGYVFCWWMFLRIRFDGRFITMKRNQPFGWNMFFVAFSQPPNSRTSNRRQTWRFYGSDFRSDSQKAECYDWNHDVFAKMLAEYLFKKNWFLGRYTTPLD